MNPVNITGVSGLSRRGEYFASLHVFLLLISFRLLERDTPSLLATNVLHEDLRWAHTEE